MNLRVLSLVSFALCGSIPSSFADTASAREVGTTCEISDPRTLRKMNAEKPVRLRIFHTARRLAVGVFRNASDPATDRSFMSRWGDAELEVLEGGAHRYAFAQLRRSRFQGVCAEELWDAPASSPIDQTAWRTDAFEVTLDPRDPTRAHLVYRVMHEGLPKRSICIRFVEDELACVADR